MKDVELSAMDRDIISKSRWDGGWPKVVCLGPGCLELAYNQEEFDALVKRANRIYIWAAVGAVACMAVMFVVIEVLLG